VSLRLEIPVALRLPLTAGICFAGVLAALVLIATPSAQASRHKAAADRIAVAEKTAAASHGGLGAYPEDPICTGSLSAAMAHLNARVQNTAQASGLELRKADIVDGGATPSRRFRQVKLSMEVGGRYEAIVGLLDALGRSGPVLVLDSVELDGFGGAQSARLHLEGRVLCRA
jgi:hypothetical protein